MTCSLLLIGNRNVLIGVLAVFDFLIQINKKSVFLCCVTNLFRLKKDFYAINLKVFKWSCIFQIKTSRLILKSPYF